VATAKDDAPSVMDDKPAAKAARYEVVAALAICYVEGQGQVYVYKGGVIPSNTDPDHVKHLLDSHIIAAV
jgi:hypothetical protein